MSQDVQQLLVVLDATTERLRRELGRADDEVNNRTRRMRRSLSQLDGAFGSLNHAASRAASSVAGIFAAAGGTFGVAAFTKSVIETADAYKNLEGRLKLVTSSSAELADVQKKLFELV